MEKYKVVFEFINELGEIKKDNLTNNGKGFNYDEVTNIKQDLKATENIIYVSVENM